MRFIPGLLRRVVLGCGLLTTVALASDLDSFAGLSGTLNIAGGTAHIPVMQKAAKVIMQANSDIRITIAGGGSA